MARKPTPTQYVRGHAAMVIAAGRYVAEAKGIERRVAEQDGDPTDLLHMTGYIGGLIDATNMYLSAVNGTNDDAARAINVIDSKLMSIRGGGTGGKGIEDEPEPDQERV